MKKAKNQRKKKDKKVNTVLEDIDEENSESTIKKKNQKEF